MSRYGEWVIKHHDRIVERFDTKEEARSHFKEQLMSAEQGYFYFPILFKDLTNEERFTFFQSRVDMITSYTSEEISWLLEQAMKSHSSAPQVAQEQLDHAHNVIVENERHRWKNPNSPESINLAWQINGYFTAINDLGLSDAVGVRRAGPHYKSTKYTKLEPEVKAKDFVTNSVVTFPSLLNFCHHLITVNVDDDRIKSEYLMYIQGASEEVLAAFPSLYQYELLDSEITPDHETLERDLQAIIDKHNTKEIDTHGNTHS